MSSFGHYGPREEDEKALNAFSRAVDLQVERMKRNKANSIEADCVGRIPFHELGTDAECERCTESRVSTPKSSQLFRDKTDEWEEEQDMKRQVISSIVTKQTNPKDIIGSDKEVGIEESKYKIKDSGKRAEFSSGMVRDVADDKINYSLIADGPMLRRWAVHLTNGAKKYAARNWMKANGEEEKQRFRESAFRHFMQWYYGEEDEDHASATYFNINGFEYVKKRMS